MSNAVITFDASQRAFYECTAPVAYALWHRRKGKDFVSAAVAFDDAIKHGRDWWIVAMTQAQADETFAKVMAVAAAFKSLLQHLFGTHRGEREDEAFDDYSSEIRHTFRATNRILRLPNGARIGSLPGRNPDTLAGRGGSMIWTEFALWEGGGYKHWRTLFPIITRGGHKLRIITTPRGKNTRAYEAWSGGEYSNSFCDIHQSVHHEGYRISGADGHYLPNETDEQKDASIEYLKRQYADAVGWERDFECKWTGDASSLIAWAELERAAGMPSASRDVLIELTGDAASIDDADLAGLRELAGEGSIAIGWDVARRGHISAVAVNLVRHNQPSDLVMLVLMRDCSFEAMRRVVSQIMDASRRGVGFGDATGLGMESNETLQKKYGERWTPFTFTATGKREVASALKTAFTDGTQTLPPLDGPHKFVATDLYAIQKDDTGANLTLSESVNPLLEESHCDIAYAIGLARLAGAAKAVHSHITHTGRKPVWA